MIPIRYSSIRNDTFNGRIILIGYRMKQKVASRNRRVRRKRQQKLKKRFVKLLKS